MTQEQKDAELASLIEPVHKGANWFYWIVGLSVVNVVLALAKANTHFIIGLAYGEIATALINPEEANTFMTLFGSVMLLSVLGGFLFLGKKAHQPHKILYMAGIILYAIDGLIYLAVQDFLPALFHAYATWCLWTGYKAIDPYLAVLNEEVTTEPEVVQIPAMETAVARVEQTPFSAPAEEDPYKPIY